MAFGYRQPEQATFDLRDGLVPSIGASSSPVVNSHHRSGTYRDRSLLRQGERFRTTAPALQDKIDRGLIRAMCSEPSSETSAHAIYAAE
jgi:hypothetical protein